VDKEYEVQLNRPLREPDRRRLLAGIELEEGLARAVALRMHSPRCCSLVIRQGWNRQVKRMFEALDFEVLRLVRVRMGNLHIGELPAGRWRVLGEAEVQSLMAGA
jgi:pseudouridine synthase